MADQKTSSPGLSSLKYKLMGYEIESFYSTFVDILLCLFCFWMQIQISVKTLHGEVIGKLDILTSEKIAEVKAKIGAKTGISAENQRLIYAGRETVDDRSLADYDVRRFTSLHLIKRQGEITK